MNDLLYKEIDGLRCVAFNLISLKIKLLIHDYLTYINKEAIIPRTTDDDSYKIPTYIIFCQTPRTSYDPLRLLATIMGVSL